MREASFSRRCIEFIDVIEDIRIVSQGLIAMSAPPRYIQSAVVIGGQFDSQMLQVGRAFRAKIHDHIENGTTRAANEFAFSRRRILKVHAADRSLPPGRCNIGLGSHQCESVFLELFLTVGASEEAALISEALEANHARASQFCFFNYHREVANVLVSPYRVVLTTHGEKGWSEGTA